jgi:hypothetical protein
MVPTSLQAVLCETAEEIKYGKGACGPPETIREKNIRKYVTMKKCRQKKIIC